MRALVVGGSSHIGASCARMLTELGHEVLLWGRDSTRLAVAATSCGARPTALTRRPGGTCWTST